MGYKSNSSQWNVFHAISWEICKIIVQNQLILNQILQFITGYYKSQTCWKLRSLVILSRDILRFLHLEKSNEQFQPHSALQVSQKNYFLGHIFVHHFLNDTKMRPVPIYLLDVRQIQKKVHYLRSLSIKSSFHDIYNKTSWFCMTVFF